VTFLDIIQNAVVCFLEAKNRDEALYQLVKALKKNKVVQNAKHFFNAILKREMIVSTGIGRGVAIPHAKLEKWDHFFLAIGIQKGKEGIEWDALDKMPVRLIFMIGGPDNQQTEYLKILSRLTTAIKDEERRMKILFATSREDVIKLLEGC